MHILAHFTVMFTNVTNLILVISLKLLDNKYLNFFRIMEETFFFTKLKKLREVKISCK